jgi:membrane protease YdiL (CAAX protease family)
MNFSTDPPDKIVIFLKKFFVRNQLKPTVILLYSTLAMIFWYYFSLPFATRLHLAEMLEENQSTAFLWGTSKIFSAFLVFGLLPILIVKLIFQEKLADYGLQKGNGLRLIRGTLICVPVMLILGFLTSYNSSYLTVYPYNPAVTNSPEIFLCHAATYLTYYFGWEFFFRGFLQNGLRDSLGIYHAILIQTMASTMLHFGHPCSEVLASIFGGIFWGILAVRCRSIWSGFIQHSILGITLDWFLLKNKMTDGNCSILDFTFLIFAEI